MSDTTSVVKRGRRERPKAVRLTARAAERIRTVVERSEKPVAGVRLSLKNAGCAGMTYALDFADAPKAGDETVEDQGARVFIDPKAILFVIGTEMDYVSDKMQSRFVFNNPNQTDACGCGESVALKAVDES